MGIYIKGVEMPTDGDGILIDWHGNVSIIGDEIKDVPTAHAVELPPHGRLIEAERLKEVFHRNVASGEAFDQLIDIAPTIIPASEEGNT